MNLNIAKNIDNKTRSPLPDFLEWKTNLSLIWFPYSLWIVLLNSGTLKRDDHSKFTSEKRFQWILCFPFSWGTNETTTFINKENEFPFMRPLIGKKETKNHYHMSFFELNENIIKREGNYGSYLEKKSVHIWRILRYLRKNGNEENGKHINERMIV